MEHKSIKYVISVFVFHLVRANMTDPNWKLSQYEAYQAQIDIRRILEYGDWCNTYAENVFTEISRSSEKINSLSSLEAELNKINAVFEKLLLHGHNFCNSRKLLVCDKSTNLCSCGPRRVKNQEFKYVQDSNGRCLYAKNTACYPNDYQPGKHYNCANNTNCVFFDATHGKINCDLPNLRKAEKTTPTQGTAQCYCRDDTFHTTYYDEQTIKSVSNTLEMSSFCLIITLFFSIYL